VIILGVDPGMHTGAVMLDLPRMLVTFSVEMSVEDFFDSARLLVGQANIVAVEQFTISMRTLQMTRQPDALHIIGILRFLCHERSTPMLTQLVADAKASFSDETLRDLHVWSSSNHIRDATRHALLAARRSGHDVHVDV
jgi:predicted RNase H-like nuclease (RuvC/YqgF family)